jgi:hypothetical protein
MGKKSGNFAVAEDVSQLSRLLFTKTDTEETDSKL